MDIKIRLMVISFIFLENNSKLRIRLLSQLLACADVLKYDVYLVASAARFKTNALDLIPTAVHHSPTTIAIPENQVL